MNIITATATATPTRRSVTITVEIDGTVTEHTESWVSPDLGRALQFVGELHSSTMRLIGTRVAWMLTEQTADLIVLTLDDGTGEDEDDGEEWLIEDSSDWIIGGDE